ncbi:hypothetical protein QWY85_03375 [Neolewinella lacunae]|uniref:Uncharacterized protein n=1 Tax=Neolewinella lacunae TaxID=1517758 RepID=A0A923PEJ7_9BACT|nr:hypothetical protein [Neolewinella lacunae]MBC6992625.1 hypothetical protein [Neolewinella lacunae]MDN3633682.1 hypothetical protein [Neolewinella lacunae]
MATEMSILYYTVQRSLLGNISKDVMHISLDLQGDVVVIRAVVLNESAFNEDLKKHVSNCVKSELYYLDIDFQVNCITLNQFNDFEFDKLSVHMFGRAIINLI